MLLSLTSSRNQLPSTTHSKKGLWAQGSEVNMPLEGIPPVKNAALLANFAKQFALLKQLRLKQNPGRTVAAELQDMILTWQNASTADSVK